ncbi:hypothetical protein AB0Y82_20105 [Escherichia coli]
MVGSRWYKFDFHNHTPASHDYKIPDISPREWLLAYMKQHVDCVVMRIPLYSITDWHRSPISDSHPFDQPGT